MKQLLWGLLFSFAVMASASASICPSVPNTFTNGSVADANQVNANFQALLNCFNTGTAAAGANTNITSLLGLTTPLSVPQGGTGSATGDLRVTAPGSTIPRGVVERAGEVFDALDWLVPDGVTGNSMAALASAVSAASGGASILFPCGVYKITGGAPTFSVPAGRRIQLEGMGQDCVELWFSGSNGPLFNYGSVTSSVGASQMSITTDGATYTGLSLTNPYNNGVGQSNQFGPENPFDHVLFRGHDQYTANTQYWSTAFREINVSNINFTGGGCNGVKATPEGDCYTLQGDIANQSYSVAINFIGTAVNNCGTGITVGNWVQGVQYLIPNVTGCENGVIVQSASTGQGSGLGVIGGQIFAFLCGVCVNDTTMANTQLIGTQYIIPANATGAKVQGTNFSVAGGNQFNGIGTASTSGTIGLILAASSGNGGTVSGNALSNLHVALQVPASTAQTVDIFPNQFVNNNTDYSIGAGTTGVRITDTKPRLLASIPACASNTIYDQWVQADGSAPGYNGVATSGGADVVPLVCDGSNLKNH